MPDQRFTPQDQNDGFVAAIDIRAKDGEAKTVAKILGDLIAPTLAEPGATLFRPYRAPEDPARFFIFEFYRSKDSRAAHQETAHFKAAIAALLQRVCSRERVPFVPYATV